MVPLLRQRQWDYVCVARRRAVLLTEPSSSGWIASPRGCRRCGFHFCPQVHPWVSWHFRKWTAIIPLWSGSLPQSVPAAAGLSLRGQPGAAAGAPPRRGKGGAPGWLCLQEGRLGAWYPGELGPESRRPQWLWLKMELPAATEVLPRSPGAVLGFVFPCWMPKCSAHSVMSHSLRPHGL